VFKQRQNKRFNYKPRFQNSEAETAKQSFEAKWNDARPKTKRRKSVLTSLPALLIMLLAVIIFMYILNGYIE